MLFMIAWNVLMIAAAILLIKPLSNKAEIGVIAAVVALVIVSAIEPIVNDRPTTQSVLNKPESSAAQSAVKKSEVSTHNVTKSSKMTVQMHIAKIDDVIDSLKRKIADNQRLDTSALPETMSDALRKKLKRVDERTEELIRYGFYFKGHRFDVQQPHTPDDDIVTKVLFIQGESELPCTVHDINGEPVLINNPIEAYYWYLMRRTAVLQYKASGQDLKRLMAKTDDPAYFNKIEDVRGPCYYYKLQ